MRKRGWIRYLSLIAAICVVLTVSGTYATWWYSQGRLPDPKTTNIGISLIFPIPTNGLYITSLPSTSGNLWGAMDENGKVESVSKAQEYLLKDYSPFGIDVANKADKAAQIYFQIDLCLCEYYIKAEGWPRYPFQDQLTITRKNSDGTQKVILSGDMYYPTKSGSTSGEFQLLKVSDETMYSNTLFSYKLYTVTIDPSQLDPNVINFDINDFVVQEGESATFVLTMQHTQYNNYACFAEIKVLAKEYTPQ